MINTEVTVFLSLCRHKNISKAAKALGITQASVSAHLKTLERKLNCELMVRSKGKRNLVLTPQGEAFYKLALRRQSILQDMNLIATGSTVEKLCISVTDHIDDDIFTPVIKQFLKEYPHVQLWVKRETEDAAFSNILKGRTHIAFSTVQMKSDQIAAIPFWREPYAVIGSADSCYSETVDLRELSRWDEVYIKWSDMYELWHKSVFGKDLRSQFQVDSVKQIEMFVSLPNKWAVVPKHIADRICAVTSLKQCIPTFQIPKRYLYILHRRNDIANGRIKDFLEILQAVLKMPYGENLLL